MYFESDPCQQDIGIFPHKKISINIYGAKNSLVYHYMNI